MIRRINPTDCLLIHTPDPPPHPGAVALGDLDGDGTDELIVGSSSGSITIFRFLVRKDFTVQSNDFLDLQLGALVVINVGRFVLTTHLLTAVAVSVCGQAKLLGHDGSKLSTLASVLVPMNSTASLVVPRGPTLGHVLILGTSEGNLHVVDFTDEAVKIPVVNVGMVITSLALTQNGVSSVVVVGMINGDIALHSWPYLERIGGVPQVGQCIVGCGNIMPHKYIISSIERGFLKVYETELETPRKLGEVLLAEQNDELLACELLRVPPNLATAGATAPELTPVLAAVLHSGRTTFCSEMGGFCVFDPAELFTAPLRAFTAGTIGSALDSDGTSCSTSPVGLYLVYCLGNGEILVFHSLAQQVGSLLGYKAEKEDFFGRFMVQQPQTEENLAAITSSLHEKTSSLPFKLQDSFAWVLSQSEKDIEKMEAEVSRHRLDDTDF